MSATWLAGCAQLAFWFVAETTWFAMTVFALAPGVLVGNRWGPRPAAFAMAAAAVVLAWLAFGRVERWYERLGSRLFGPSADGDAALWRGWLRPSLRTWRRVLFCLVPGGVAVLWFLATL